MRRLHRYQAIRARLNEQGVTDEEIDTNHDGVLSDEELQAAVDKIEQTRIDSLKALGIEVV